MDSHVDLDEINRKPDNHSASQGNGEKRLENLLETIKSEPLEMEVSLRARLKITPKILNID